MKCLDKSCTNQMQHRVGKYGGFWYCKDHGTISDRGVELIRKLILNQRYGSIVAGSPNYMDNLSNDLIMMQIERETLHFGVKISEIESWIVDNEGAADYEEDHWMNIRPY